MSELMSTPVHGLLRAAFPPLGRCKKIKGLSLNDQLQRPFAALKQAKAAAQKIGEVSVDVGDTARKVPLASA